MTSIPLLSFKRVSLTIIMEGEDILTSMRRVITILMIDIKGITLRIIIKI